MCDLNRHQKKRILGKPCWQSMFQSISISISNCQKVLPSKGMQLKWYVKGTASTVQYPTPTLQYPRYNPPVQPIGLLYISSGTIHRLVSNGTIPRDPLFCANRLNAEFPAFPHKSSKTVSSISFGYLLALANSCSEPVVKRTTFPHRIQWAKLPRCVPGANQSLTEATYIPPVPLIEKFTDDVISYWILIS